MIIQRPADLAVLIKSQRKAQGYTQKELAKLTGLSQRSVSSIERTGEMHTSTLLRIFAALRIQLNADAVKQNTSSNSEVIW
ncbi:helix-turn-helix domain-containing protein [Pseudidiomarina andamanensis]|uniref:Helix-turn-helix domain-containing protein n=1 Tax=Pseudidiomarina andamanensis TaxID=1940690 RepID=A0AA92EW24_9GAMM|nr:helix-turn-helix transcriptional regulator [Pseudidiomarina andamanensis]MDS0219016.1 helix-turn-helix transcriptional regulator [Pseudidiomarina andamanensis]QGT96370.1 helix-turn-helix domain-containing protein [Pseudidiomarina andamanensis]